MPGDSPVNYFSVSVFSVSAFLLLFYGEFDGRRRKRALVKIIGEWTDSARALPPFVSKVRTDPGRMPTAIPAAAADSRLAPPS
jgi:hypothetical protein